MASRVGESISARPSSSPIVRGVKTAVFLLLCTALTGVILFVVTVRCLDSSRTDDALAEMRTLLADLEARVADHEDELPLRLLTNPSRTLELPEGPLPRAYDELFPERARSGGSRADPWNHSYLLAAERRGQQVVLTCVSPGPNGRFETTADDDEARCDDLVWTLSVSGQRQ